MPNGGSDCCGTCWFNPRARAASEGDPAQRTIGHYCEIRGLAIERAYWTYCANHPHRSPARDPIPIGPVMVGKDLVREIWQLSPDTEAIRLHLLELAARIEEEPRREYPMGAYRDEVVVWQLGEFREKRAVPKLERVAGFDPNASAGEPLFRSRKTLVELARRALIRIRGES